MKVYEVKGIKEIISLSYWKTQNSNRAEDELREAKREMQITKH